MNYYDLSPFGDSQWRRNLADSLSTLAPLLVAFLAGAYTVIKILDILGFPIWFRIHQGLHMATSFVAAGSDSTTSVFSGSLLQNGVRRLTGALTPKPRSNPPGLGNISNSCYQNSVIQGLAALPSLRQYLDKITCEHPSFGNETTNGALHGMLSKLGDPNNLGQSLWIRGKLKSMSIWQQQDAQEYYSKILDEMDNEMKKALKVDQMKEQDEPTESPSEAQDEKTQEVMEHEPNPLDGLIAQRVGCTLCGYSEGLSLISFNCITVSLGRNNAYDIRECLDEYTQLEYIDGVECSKCTLLKLKKTLTPLVASSPGSPHETKLNIVNEMLEEEKLDDSALVKKLNIPKKNWVQSSKSKQIVVARAPKALVLHVNRSMFNEETGDMYKNAAGVQYPDILDFGNWCLGKAPSGSSKPDIVPEEWPRDPRQSMLSGHCEEPVSDSPFQYTLRAAVTHYGSHGNGHYVAYRPAPVVAQKVDNETEDKEEEEEEEDLGEQWWRFSDDSVYAISEEQAHQGNVFMLFYERIDESNSSTHVDREEDVVHPFAVHEDAPLPPITASALFEDIDALSIPLPGDDNDDNDDDDDIMDFVPTQITVQEAAPPSLSVYPTPPPEHAVGKQPPSNKPEEVDVSETESEDAPSSHIASDSEIEIERQPTPKPFVPVSPQMMRTAGNAASRGRGKRSSLPLVSAT